MDPSRPLASASFRRMVWRRYGRVVGQLNLFGAVVGAVLFLVVFGFLVPPDRGEESVIVFMPFVGALFGVLTSFAASVAYLVGLQLGTRNLNRSVPSLALIGAGSAAAGAALLWIGVGGAARFGTAGLAIWGILGTLLRGACGIDRRALDESGGARRRRRRRGGGRVGREFCESNEARSADRLP